MLGKNDRKLPTTPEEVAANLTGAKGAPTMPGLIAGARSNFLIALYQADTITTLRHGHKTDPRPTTR
jgi:hypothetical protein